MMFLVLCVNVLNAQYKPLYEGGIPNYTQSENKESESVGGGILRISKVSIPAYNFFKSTAASSAAPCVIICPGGGYSILAAGHEGTDVAKFFNSIGVHALVLKYRIPSDEHQVERKIAPLQDAQRAIYLVRKHATDWGVDPSRVGIMGFSAGGHLASSLATHYDDRKIEGDKTISFRPDFQILIYPVISFSKISHGGSRNNLLGKDTTVENINYFSNELHINKKSPPAFMVHAKDDGVVSIKNPIQYHERLISNGVESSLLIYEEGGHGFGLENHTSDKKWTDALKQWMIKIGVLN
jgi:acetyl esterase/lipase